MTFAFAAIAMLAIPSISNATEIKFKVTITDTTCQPQPYHGYYCATITIKDNTGSVLCQFQDCTLVLGFNQIDYNCTDFLQAYRPIYEIDITVCRQYSISCCDSDHRSNLWPYELNNNSVWFYLNVH